MRPAGLIPSFQPDRYVVSGSRRPVRVERGPSRSLSCSAFGSLRNRRGDYRCVPITGPRTAVPVCFFQDAWPRPPPRRSVSVSTVECTLHPHHSRIDSSARFRLPSLSGGPARGLPVRSWSPLARDPRPSQLGPGVFPDSRRPAPWMSSVRRTKLLSREQAVRNLCK